ncbi:MAG: DUF433 domain-containing protein [Deltaproteobacteria bacterium]|nr:DUF433 domain-containing protein [Deltaproteobacteria bacterium]
MPAIVLAPRIVANPEILGGKAIIEGTRLSVEFILGQLGRGLGVDEVVREIDSLRGLGIDVVTVDDRRRTVARPTSYGRTSAGRRARTAS